MDSLCILHECHLCKVHGIGHGQELRRLEPLAAPAAQLQGSEGLKDNGHM